MSAAQEHLIWTEGDLSGDACVGEELQSSFISVQGIVGLFGTEGAVEGCDEGGRGEGCGRSGCLFYFEVGFAGRG